MMMVQKHGSKGLHFRWDSNDAYNKKSTVNFGSPRNTTEDEMEKLPTDLRVDLKH